VGTPLYRRQVFVTLGSDSGTGTEFGDLRVTFTVKMTDGSTPNTAKIEIYNPASGSVALMQQSDAVILLAVGYESEGGVPRQLFAGNPIEGGVKLEKRGVDRVLVIEAQDGGREYASAHISESFATGSTSGQVASALIDRLGLTIGSTDGIDGDVSFPYGITMAGPVTDQLDTIAAMSGARWFIRDRAVYFSKIGETTGEQAALYSSFSGNLIDAPVQKDTGIEITALISPSMRPGKPFRIESVEITGDYLAGEVEFTGIWRARSSSPETLGTARPSM